MLSKVKNQVAKDVVAPITAKITKGGSIATTTATTTSASGSSSIIPKSQPTVTDSSVKSIVSGGSEETKIVDNTLTGQKDMLDNENEAKMALTINKDGTVSNANANTPHLRGGATAAAAAAVAVVAAAVAPPVTEVVKTSPTV